MSKSKKLNSKLMQLFVLEYIKDFNATQAAIRAGYKSDTAKQKAYGLLKDERIKQAIDEAIAERKERLHIDADNVLYKWWQIATADYNELMSVVRVACGFCYSTSVTDDDEQDQAINVTQEPDPECPICKGKGSPHVYIEDTTKLSPEGRLIYQGAKQTKYGVEVMTVDRMKALDNVARHLGMFKDKVEHTGADGGPIVTANLTPDQVIERMKELDDEY